MKESKSFWAENRKVIRTMTITLLFTGIIANATLTLPFPNFSSGNVISADQMNQNFAAIKQYLDAQTKSTTIVRMKVGIDLTFNTNDAPLLNETVSDKNPLKFNTLLISNNLTQVTTPVPYTLFTVPADGWYEIMGVQDVTFTPVNSVVAPDEKQMNLNASIEIRLGNSSESVSLESMSWDSYNHTDKNSDGTITLPDDYHYESDNHGQSKKFYLKQGETVFFMLNWSIQNPDKNLDSTYDNDGSSITLLGNSTEIIINKLY